MNELLKIHTAIYNQFHGSSAGKSYFFLPKNADAYAAYYNSMYLIQDTCEAVLTHMQRGFSSDPLQAYLEFWGVMQAINIQQDAILVMHREIVANQKRLQPGIAWVQLRSLRNLCAGHPAKRTHGVPAVQRAFMGRSFGNYDAVRYELWDANTGRRTHPVVDLRQMVTSYDTEARIVLLDVLSAMKSKWP